MDEGNFDKICQEMMGYLVELKGPGAGTPDGFFALTGCRNPTNSDDRQCEGCLDVKGWGGQPQSPTCVSQFKGY